MDEKLLFYKDNIKKPKAKSQKPKAKSQKLKANSQQPRAFFKNRIPNTENP